MFVGFCWGASLKRISFILFHAGLRERNSQSSRNAKATKESSLWMFKTHTQTRTASSTGIFPIFFPPCQFQCLCLRLTLSPLLGCGLSPHDTVCHTALGSLHHAVRPMQIDWSFQSGRAPRVVQPAFHRPPEQNPIRRRADAHHGGKFQGNDVKESADVVCANAAMSNECDSPIPSRSGVVEV